MNWFIIISILISLANVHSLVSIGAGMDGLRDWSRSRPYVNLIHQARRWGSPQAPYDGNATFDPITGWPTCDFGVVIATDNLDLGGQYLLYAKGNADVSVPGSSGYITNKTYDVASNTMTAIINVPEGEEQTFLSFRNTTGPGLQDLAVLQPGYNLTSKSDITKLTLTHVSRFSLLRFMDWTSTNGNPESNWNDTTPINWPRYADGKRNPWQTIPLIANNVGKPIDIWINIPHNSTDDYILNVARIMFSELNPDSHIYVEYSNEVWNWGFIQAKDNIHAANYSVLHDGDPHQLNYDNCGNVGYWAWRRTAYQIKHVSDLFKTIFGDDNVGPWKRVRPILAGQVVYPFVIRNGLEYLNAVYGPPSQFLHGIAGAPYFNLGEYETWTNLTTEQVLNALNINIQDMSPEQGWGGNNPVGAHAVYGAWYKLAMHGYEGGPDTSGCDNCSLEARANATRDPRMTDLCIQYLNAWYQYGFRELNWFVAGAAGMGKYGSFAILEDMRQETLIDTTGMFNATSPVAKLPRPPPKLKAIDIVRESTIDMNFGIPVPSSNVNATNFAEHRIPYPYPDLRNLGVNATFYYPLEIRQSPMQINITVYVSGNSGILEGGFNNEQFVQVQTPQTANYTTFEAAPVMQFNVNQTIVPSLAGFRLRIIQNGYNIRSFDIIGSKN